MAFTGVKDTDYKIMLELDDESLFNFCQTNKLIREYCNNDDFWFRRTVSRYGNSISKPHNQSWRDFYKHLTTVYIAVYEYDNMKSTVELKRSDPLVQKYLEEVKRIYNREYKRTHDLKPEAEVARIVGETVCKAVAYFGQQMRYKRDYDVLSLNENLFDDNHVNSVLIKKDLPGFQGWSEEIMRDAHYKLYYVDVTNNKLVTLKDAFEVWKNNPNYIYIPSLRVAGNVDDIRKYFINFGNQIDPHINVGYSKNNHKGDFQREFLEVGGQLPGVGLPMIPGQIVYF